MESNACYAVLKREANSLLASIPYIPMQTWEARLRNLFAKDEVGGPLAVMYLLQQYQKAAQGVDDPFWLEQQAACKRAVNVSHKNRSGWQHYGLPSVYHVLEHPSFPRQVRTHARTHVRTHTRTHRETHT